MHHFVVKFSEKKFRLRRQGSIAPPTIILRLFLTITACVCVVLCQQKRRACPRFVVKEMESTYIEEMKSSVSLLMANLESVPVSKGGSSGSESKYSLNKFKRYNKYATPRSIQYNTIQYKICKAPC